jgi:hypothetical protein
MANLVWRPGVTLTVLPADPIADPLLGLDRNLLQPSSQGRLTAARVRQDSATQTIKYTRWAATPRFG